MYYSPVVHKNSNFEWAVICYPLTFKTRNNAVKKLNHVTDNWKLPSIPV